MRMSMMRIVSILGMFGSLNISGARAVPRWPHRLYTLLAPHGLSRHVGEVVALHGSSAADLVLEDPYSLTAISGIGFQSADRLAVANGVEPGSRSRTRAAATHALRDAENRGHTHLPRAELVGEMRALLEAEPSLPHLEGDESIMVEDGRIYREWTWRAERWLAATLAGMAAAEVARRSRRFMALRPRNDGGPCAS